MVLKCQRKKQTQNKNLKYMALNFTRNIKNNFSRTEIILKELMFLKSNQNINLN